MRISSAFCREQEAIQQARARSEPLENQRKVAQTAAKAWREEALAIEQRNGAPTGRGKLDTAIALEFALEAAAGEDLALDEA